MAQQAKKLFFSKQFVDGGDGTTLAKWKIAPWKVSVFFFMLAVVAILIYAYFFTNNPTNFLGSVLFYAVVLILVIVGLWLVGNKAWSLKTRIGQFLICFIVLWVFYWVLGFVVGFVGLKFYFGGYALWAVMAILAGYGSKNFDGELNRKDVFFCLLVFLVFVGANLPMSSSGGFLENIDKLIKDILSVIKFK